MLEAGKRLSFLLSALVLVSLAFFVNDGWMRGVSGCGCWLFFVSLEQ